jgi:hypothetical protein
MSHRAVRLAWRSVDKINAAATECCLMSCVCDNKLIGLCLVLCLLRVKALALLREAQEGTCFVCSRESTHTHAHTRIHANKYKFDYSCTVGVTGHLFTMTSGILLKQLCV